MTFEIIILMYVKLLLSFILYFVKLMLLIFIISICLALKMYSSIIIYMYNIMLT